MLKTPQNRIKHCIPHQNFQNKLCSEKIQFFTKFQNEETMKMNIKTQFLKKSKKQKKLQKIDLKIEKKKRTAKV